MTTNSADAILRSVVVPALGLSLAALVGVGCTRHSDPSPPPRALTEQPASPTRTTPVTTTVQLDASSPTEIDVPNIALLDALSSDAASRANHPRTAISQANGLGLEHHRPMPGPSSGAGVRGINPPTRRTPRPFPGTQEGGSGRRVVEPAGLAGLMEKPSPRHQGSSAIEAATIAQTTIQPVRRLAQSGTKISIPGIASASVQRV